jgi:hypothetical protein
MIVIQRVQPEVMIVQERHRPQPPEPSSPGVVNVSSARELTRPSVLTFREKVYLIPPTPWEDGLTLLELATRLEKLGADEDADPAEMLKELRATMQQIIDLCWNLVRPHRIPRWIWKLRRNPFNRADMDELREIIAVFGRPRMT